VCGLDLGEASQGPSLSSADRIFNSGFPHGEGLLGSLILKIYKHLRNFAIA
jgi:hypothetical protein